MYFLLGFSLILAVLLAINIVLSFGTELVRRAAAPFLKKIPARKKSRIVFGLGVLPLVVAVVFVGAFLIPAYLLFEPSKSEETVSLKLAALAGLSLAGIAVALYRVFGSWWTTRRLVANWLKNAEPVALENVPVPVYRIEHRFPVIAVVGAFRPRVFIAGRIFDVLEPAELAAALAHEKGHLAARDNFKRVLLRISRDLLVFPFGKALERAWAATAETAADEFAAQSGRRAAVELASALVKIVRLVPPDVKPAISAGTFLVSEETEHISDRVERLLRLSSEKAANAENKASGGDYVMAASLVAVCAAVALFATNSQFLQLVHELTESIVAALQ
ncbi:MAG: M48 family metalloprotease [Acidobacteria bacterium]|nr:M48 family metalloprotease [Acidobacteriota bacterium]